MAKVEGFSIFTCNSTDDMLLVISEGMEVAGCCHIVFPYVNIQKECWIGIEAALKLFSTERLCFCVLDR